MITFMNESYIKYGGEDNAGYNKYLRKHIDDLEQQKNVSEIEMARNAFNPDKSDFLSPQSQNLAQSLLEDKLINSRYLVETSKANIDLSKKIQDYLNETKVRKTRNEELGAQVYNIVSYLESNDVESSKLADVSTLLLGDVTKNEMDEAKVKRDNILQEKNAAEQLEMTQITNNKSQNSKKGDKKVKKGKDKKEKGKVERVQKKDKTSKKAKEIKEKKTKQKRDKTPKVKKEKKEKRTKSPRLKKEKKEKTDKKKEK